MQINLTTAGRLGFLLDYSERSEVGAHTFYLTRTHGTQGVVGCTWTAYDSADGSQLATGSASWGNLQADIKSFTVNVSSKPAGDHRIYVLLSNATGGAVLHHGENETVAYGIIDDDTIATSNTIFIDADAVTDGDGSQGNPYNNWYSARDAVTVSTRFIYIKGLMIPGDDGTAMSQTVKHFALRSTFEGRTSEAQRLVIRNWPGFIGGIDGNGQTDCAGFACDGASSTTLSVKYITFKGLRIQNLDNTDGGTSSGKCYFLRTRGNTDDVVGIFTAEHITIDGVISGANAATAVWYSESCENFKLWKWHVSNATYAFQPSYLTTLQVYRTDRLSVQGCTFTNTTGSIYEKEALIDVTGIGSVIRFNTFDNCGVRISTQGGRPALDFHAIQHNLFRTSVQSDSEIPLRFDLNATTSVSTKQLITNNVFHGYNHPSIGAIYFDTDGWQGAQIYNNIFFEVGKPWRFDSDAVAAEFIDYNTYYNNVLPAPEFNYITLSDVSLADIQAQTSFAANALTSDPLFTDATNGEYTLQSGSPSLTGGVDSSKQGIDETYYTTNETAIQEQSMIGFNFRATEVYVTDAAGDEFVNQAVTYPTLSQGVNYGWVSPTAALLSVNRSTSVDPRLAGVVYVDNNDPVQLFATDSGAGTFNVRLALGDATSSTTTNYVRIVEVNSSQVVQGVLATVASGSTAGTGQWQDATGVVRTSATDWVNNNAPLEVTVSPGNSLGIEIGDPTASGAQVTKISHFYYESVASDGITIDESGETFYQRRKNGARNINFSGTYSGSPTSLEFRVVDTVTASVLQDWAVFDSSPTGGAYSHTFDAQGNINPQRIEVRYTNDTGITAQQTQGWTVGDNILIAGQSLGEDFKTDGSVTALDGYTFWNGSAFVSPTKGEGQWQLANAIIQSEGVAVRIINTAVGSTPLTPVEANYWNDPTGTLWTNTLSAVQAVTNSVNEIAMMYWHQGNNDAALNVSEADYKQGLDEFFARVRASITGGEGEALPIFIAHLGRDTRGGNSDASFTGVRKAEYSKIVEDANTYGFNAFASNMPDGVHLSVAEYGELGKRLAATYYYYKGDSALYSPLATSVTNGATASQFDLNYDSNLIDDGPYSTEGIRVTDDDVEVAVSSFTRKNATTATIEIASPASGEVKVWTSHGAGDTNTQLNYPKLEVTIPNTAITTHQDAFPTFGVIAQGQPANQAPTANAGTNQSVAAGAAVALDGTGSTDSDGTIVSYAWTQTLGDTVTLTGANTATPSFTAPSTNAAQTLTFELTVTDDGGLTDTDTVNVQVAAQSARPFFINNSRNFNFFDSDGIWTDKLRVTETDSYTMTIDPNWISPETITSYSVTPKDGLTVVAHAREDNVIQVYLTASTVGRTNVRFDFETATRSDHVVVTLDVVS